ncbi:aminotransferase [Lysobacteraceae bacterium NML91-0213]|nr:aminotransferase [Xanthomonadaceae bacterium NML91-0213]
MGACVSPHGGDAGQAPDDPKAAGHFTTLQVRGGLVQGRDLHLLRLRNASREMYGGGPGRRGLRSVVRRGLAEAGRAGRDCTLRVLVRPEPADAGPGDGSVFSPPFECAHLQRPGVVPPAQRVDIEVEAPREVPASALRLRSHRGLRAWPDVKHLATGPQLRARAAAMAAGFDDALLVSGDGHIAEGTFWNIAFWDGSVLTWPMAPALAGVTSWRLHMALPGAGIAERRAPVGLGDLAGQRAALAVNSRGIQEVAAIDGHAFPGDPGIAKKLRALLASDRWEAF